MSAVGDFTDLTAAGSFVASSGTPTTFVVDEAQNVIAVQLEHAWVQAYVTHPRTGRHVWANLDAALKRTRFREPPDFENASELTARRLEAILAAGTFDVNRDSVTNINAARIERQLERLQDRLEKL